jgi:hypothetical protein
MDVRSIPAYRPTVEMPHVHVAALRMQQQQRRETSATLLSETFAMRTDSSESHTPECTAHSQQDQEGANQACAVKSGKPTGAEVCDGSRRMSKAENVMKEWGFENEATAMAYLQSKRRMQNKKLSKNARRIHPTTHTYVCIFS